MSQFAAHGHYTLHWHDDVAVLALGNLFNREGAELTLGEVARSLNERGETPWALLVDAREWQGGTPDAFAFWMASISAWIEQKQLVAFAALYAESVQQFMGSGVRAELSARLPYFSSPDEAACWQWLRERGLTRGNAGSMAGQ